MRQPQQSERCQRFWSARSGCLVPDGGGCAGPADAKQESTDVDCLGFTGFKHSAGQCWCQAAGISYLRKCVAVCGRSCTQAHSATGRQPPPDAADSLPGQSTYVIARCEGTQMARICYFAPFQCKPERSIDPLPVPRRMHFKHPHKRAGRCSRDTY